jgi:hypothetical protein
MEKRQYEGRLGDDNREPSTPKKQGVIQLDPLILVSSFLKPNEGESK